MIIWFYDKNLFERVCSAVMTMRGISLIWCWQSFHHMIVWSWSYGFMIKTYDKNLWSWSYGFMIKTYLKEYAVPWWPWEGSWWYDIGNHFIIWLYDDDHVWSCMIMIKTYLRECAVPWWPWEESQCKERPRSQRPASKLCSERHADAPE